MKKYISLFFFFLLLFPLITSLVNFTVNATDDYTENFDNDVLGGKASEGDWFETSTGGGFSVSDSVSYSGTNCFSVNEGFFYINLTNFNISQFQFRVYMGGVGSTQTKYMYLKNDDNDTIHEFRMLLQDNGAYDWWTIYRSETDFQFQKGTWCIFKFTILSDYSLNVSVYDEGGTLRDYYDSGVSIAFSEFSRIYFKKPTNAGIYVDDLIFSGNEESGYNQDELNNYIKKCHGTTQKEYFYWTGVGIEDMFPFKINSTIRAVDLYLNGYHLQSPMTTGLTPEECLSNYGCYVNGVNIFQPDYWIPNGDDYILRWVDVNVSVEDENPVFEFKHTFQDSNGNNWYYGVGSSPYTTTHKRHNDYGKFNGVWDGVHIPKEVQMCFYYDGQLPTNPNYNDMIYSDRDTYNIYDKVLFTSHVSLPPNSYPTYIQLWKDGERVTIQNYDGNGIRVLNWVYQSYFVPIEEGDYNVTLFRSGANVTYYEFTVTKTGNFDNFVYTVPFVTNVGQTFKVNYNYDGEGGDATVIVSDNSEGVGYSVVKGGITENGSVEYSIDDEGKYYFWLCVYENNSYFPISNAWEHLNGIDYTISKIEVTYTDLDIGREGESGRQYFKTEHPYIEQEVIVYLNGIPIKNVGYTKYLSFGYDIYDEGTYEVTLELLTDSGSTVLDTTTFYAIRDTSVSADDGFLDIFSSIPIWIKGLVGAIITIGFVFMPFIMVQYLEKIKFKVDIPPVAYAMSGGVGVVLCTMIGLFDWSIMFFICVIAGISLVISYVWNERSD